MCNPYRDQLFPISLQTCCNISSLLKKKKKKKKPLLTEQQIRRHHKETNKSRSWDKTTSLVSSKVNVMKTGEMVLGSKTLVRHNNQMQYVNLGWILVQKTKTKTFETKHIRNNREN